MGPPRGRGGYPPRGAMSSRGSPTSRGFPPSSYGRGGYGPRPRGDYSNGPAPPGMIPAGLGRRPPPGYPPPGSNDMQNSYGPSQGMAGPGPNTPYVRAGDAAYEPPSPSNYSFEPNAAYGARAQSPAARRASPYGSRTQSPSGARAPIELAPAVPPMPVLSQYAQASHQRAPTDYDPNVPGMINVDQVYAQPPLQQRSQSQG